VLRRHAGRCGHRRQRLDALARARHQQARAIIPQRRGSIGMANHANQRLDIVGKRASLLSRNRLAIAAIAVVPEGIRDELAMTARLQGQTAPALTRRH
jgi:hypothetical protein